MSDRPTMIFHVPFRLNPEATSASGLRPVKMRRAFEAAGFDVIEVSGRHPERRTKIRDVKRRISHGLQVHFVYSEAATTPTGLGEPVTLATSLSRDIRFLRFCKRHGIPVGMFYRDVYWQFPIYDELVRWPLSAAMRILYRRDLRAYRRADIEIFLPSLEMEKWVPILQRERIDELPPGCEVHQAESESPHTGRLRLLYVGGLGNNYRLHESVRIIAGRDDVELTICTREKEWLARQAEYPSLPASNVRVVHANGEALHALYAHADATLLAVEPIPYWAFAVPMKLLESIGYGLPVIATQDTFTGRFVGSNNAGWTVQYGTPDLADLITRLHESPSQLRSATEHVRAIRDSHTWKARARQVEEKLTGSLSQIA